MSRHTQLDVSHYHAEGREPFEDIMAAADRLTPGDVLVLINTFEPVPLYAYMAAKGFAHETRQEAEARWVMTFTMAAAEATTGRP